MGRSKVEPQSCKVEVDKTEAVNPKKKNKSKMKPQGCKSKMLRSSVKPQSWQSLRRDLSCMIEAGTIPGLLGRVWRGGLLFFFWLLVASQNDGVWSGDPDGQARGYEPAEHTRIAPEKTESKTERSQKNRKLKDKEKHNQETKIAGRTDPDSQTSGCAGPQRPSKQGVYLAGPICGGSPGLPDFSLFFWGFLFCSLVSLFFG
ncbi:hypothetical protein METBIDRAFT_202646 [Metschnikowia bicuspidata var. bicuspidata NRRL YB-4993]|uniref:Uncharacterized protein n=1 Tax=Metschnikowia bicuspidata var. bicuspidata NRRL YB-4993 TaxID=869754 RepID=A0A1A0H9W2_9ASCO|nr:hypothetical protein METBIDRAFT_202646 [Metschnikowia bicuspidata var. bicuspidata NRRL YB-4993]OBA20663.1 hypothetical protein METBIDRAFT_202646 [Metschnikowia bicuspidata var. bicuspidata NRRL YB-4993]